MSPAEGRDDDISHDIFPGLSLFLLALSLEWMHAQLDSLHRPGMNPNMCIYPSISTGSQEQSTKIPKRVRAALSSSTSDIQMPFEFSGKANSSASKLIPHKPQCHLARFPVLLSDPQDHIFPNERHHVPDDPRKKSSLTCGISTAKATKQISGLA